MKTIQSKSGKKITFRSLTMADLPRVFKWVKKIEAEDTFVLINPHEAISLKEEKEFFKNLVTAIKRKQKVSIGAFSENQYIGNCSVEKLAKRQGHIGRLGIALLQNYRSEGIGRQLAEHTIEVSKKKLKLKQIILACFVNNKVGLTLYRKMGFKQYGVHSRAILYKGKLVDEILFYKDLK